LETIEIPEGVSVDIDGNLVKITRGQEKVERRTSYPAIKEGSKIIIGCEKPTKKDKRLIKSTSAHLKNLLSGLGEKYVYKLQICSVHFPISAAVKGEDFVIKNFLGEVKERTGRILDGVNVKVEKDIVTVESADKEKAGQTAANIERATKITKRDRRIFQDGIYIIEKQKGVKK
jgi:large subunit ribosomal protein L6